MKLCGESALSKKLKRRIHDLCGFKDLDRDERLSRAHEILSSNDLKQAICHQILGATFRDVERAMDSIINERQLTPSQEEELELRESNPEKFEPKFDAELEFKLNKNISSNYVPTGYRVLTREEVAELVAASDAPCEPTPEREPVSYRTYSREEVEWFVYEHDQFLAEEAERKRQRVKSNK